MKHIEGWRSTWSEDRKEPHREQTKQQFPRQLGLPLSNHRHQSPQEQLRKPLRESLRVHMSDPHQEPNHHFAAENGKGSQTLVHITDTAQVDKEAINRFMTADLFKGPLQHIPQSPVTGEIPFFVSRSSTGTNASAHEASHHLPPLQLPPTCMDGDMCELSNFPVGYHDSLRSCTAGHGFGKISHQMLNGKEPAEVVNIFRSLSSDPFVRLAYFWKICCEKSTIREHVMRLLDDSGIRLERRKRMTTRIAPEEKKAIRAQRNRERSQALRRHQKRRLALLEEANRHLAIENGAIKAMILAVGCMSHDEGFLGRCLRHYAGKELVRFLGINLESEKAEQEIKFVPIN